MFGRRMALAALLSIIGTLVIAGVDAQWHDPVINLVVVLVMAALVFSQLFLAAQQIEVDVTHFPFEKDPLPDLRADPWELDVMDLDPDETA